MTIQGLAQETQSLFDIMLLRRMFEPQNTQSLQRLAIRLYEEFRHLIICGRIYYSQSMEVPVKQ